MYVKLLKSTLTGVVIGAIGGPIIAGLTGFLFLSATWFIQGLAQRWPSEEIAQIIPWTLIFGVLVAPIGAAVGVIVGSIIGAFGRWFGSLVNAGSFGGLVGSVIGLLVAFPLFGDSNEIATVVVAIVALATTGIVIAISIKQIQRRHSP